MQRAKSTVAPATTAMFFIKCFILCFRRPLVSLPAGWQALDFTAKTLRRPSLSSGDRAALSSRAGSSRQAQVEVAQRSHTPKMQSAHGRMRSYKRWTMHSPKRCCASCMHHHRSDGDRGTKVPLQSYTFWYTISTTVMQITLVY
jgi:hypothetical protein